MLEIQHVLTRVLLIGISLVGIFFFVLPMMAKIINLGNVLGLLASLFLLGFTVFNKPVAKFLGILREHIAGKIVLSCIGVFFCLGVLLCLVLSVMMLTAANKKPKDTPQAIIVLGCKVKGEKPSRMLARRLETAYNALEHNPDMICVVSGGKGSDEQMTEAQCMYEWLTAKGIDENRIIQEDKSASTSENLRFSKEKMDLLDSIQASDTQILIATDGYHQYRAQYLAKQEGFSKTAAASAYTSWYLLPTYWIREWFGIVHAFVFGS